MAFFFSGRFSVMVTTPSSDRLTSIVSIAATVPAGPAAPPTAPAAEPWRPR
jgi:hypothetical protein